jgi:CBS domain-containing protein
MKETPMTTATGVPTTPLPYLGEHQTVAEAARMMRDLSVGALPVCDDDKLRGVITERDILLGCVAEGRDPAVCTVAELTQSMPHAVPGDVDAAEVVGAMTAFRRRHVPVVADDDAKTLIAMITEGDVARHASPDQLAELIRAIARP